MKFSHTLETSASAEAIWSLWTTIEQWPVWDSELKAARLSGPFRLGATGELTPKKGPTSTFEISALDPNRSYTFATQLPLCRLNVHRFLEFDEIVRFTHEVSFEGRLAFAFSWLLGRRFQRVLPEVMRSLRQLAEQTTEVSKGL